MVWMGRQGEPERRENEGPMHERVISKGFFLGKYEVTQAQWISVMEWRPWLGKDKKYVEESPQIPAGLHILDRRATVHRQVECR